MAWSLPRLEQALVIKMISLPNCPSGTEAMRHTAWGDGYLGISGYNLFFPLMALDRERWIPLIEATSIFLVDQRIRLVSVRPTCSFLDKIEDG